MGLKRGGFGPGSYFPWIYVQIAFLLPLFRTCLDKYHGIFGAIILLLISEAFEILLSITHLSDNINRLLMPRYVFLLFFGWLFAKGKIKINWKTTTLALLSAMAIIYFEYCPRNNEPLFYCTGFEFHRWPCCFWLAYGLIPILYRIWGIIKYSTYFERIIKTLARCSYEVFLLQMALLFLFQKENLSLITNKGFQYVMWLIIVWALSLIGGYWLNKLIKSICLKEGNAPEYK